MKAIVYKEYGPPEVAQLMEVDKPTPKEYEVLVKVHASTVNRTDAGFRSAVYFISRFWSGLFKPKFQILGCEFAGTVEALGKNAGLFNIGDEVFGYNDQRFGGHAEYLTINENEAIATLPNNMTWHQSAALTEGSHYALSIIKAANVKANQKVMVYGATGAIGSAAVQLLKYYNAHVTAVGNTKNVQLLKNLGADVVIDYQTQDFRNTDTKFDFIMDAVGKTDFKTCKPLLQKKGLYVSSELGKNGENIFYALFTPLLRRKKVLFPIPTMNKEILLFLKQRAELGNLTPVIDRVYNMNQIAEAYTYVESGNKTGNVILSIGNE
jgi:NADPH:quinone reductase-like Zn-dependent oxidoreductase